MASLRLARLDLMEGQTRSCLLRCRDVFARARARGFEGLALEALVIHADWHAQHGDRTYAQQLRAWLEDAPSLGRSERDHARSRRAAADADSPALSSGVARPTLDIAAAAARLLAPHPGIAD